MRVTTLILILALIGGGLYFAWKKGYIGQAQKEVKESFAVHFNAGQGLYQTQKYEEAIKELEKAVELEPNHGQAPESLVRVGDCYKEMKQPQKALEYYQRVLDNYPDFKMRGQVEQSIEKVRTMGYF